MNIVVILFIFRKGIFLQLQLYAHFFRVFCGPQRHNVPVHLSDVFIFLPLITTRFSPCFQFPMPVTMNLPVFGGIFSVSVSWLHLIMPPIKVAGSHNCNSVINKRLMLQVKNLVSDLLSQYFCLKKRLLNVLLYTPEYHYIIGTCSKS